MMTEEERIPYANWPDDAPFKQEGKVLSIVVGHSSLHWSLHVGSKEEFYPVIFWKYVSYNSREKKTGISERRWYIYFLHLKNDRTELLFVLFALSVGY